MVTSGFVLFLDIINMGAVFPCYGADLTHGKKGRRVESENSACTQPRAECPVVFI